MEFENPSPRILPSDLSLSLPSWSGNPPPDRNYIYSQLNTAEDELHKLDADLAVILAKRSRLIRQIYRYRASLAPCNKLPFELISEIIKINLSELESLPLAPGKMDPRLQMTQISSHWRRAAFEVSELWNNIHLKNCDRNSCIKLITAWLQQSTSARIDLKVSGSAVPYSLTLDFEAMLLYHSRRFETLDLIPLDVNYFSGTPFDALTSLSLMYCTNETNRGEPMIAPNLRHFRMTHIFPSKYNKLLQFLPSIPWTQLTSIDLEGSFRFGDVCEILPQCRSLEQCRVVSANCDFPDAYTYSVDLQRLKSLEVQLGSLDSSHQLFSLVAPNLTKLTINMPQRTPEILQKFTVFTKTFKNTLRHLEFKRAQSGHAMTEAQTDQIMHLFPSVTRFIAKELRITLGMLSSIGLREVLPHLKVLEFRAQYNDRIEDIARVLIPRSSDHSIRLRDVYINTDQRYCSGEYLSDLHDMGVNIWAVYRYPHVVGTGVGGAVGTWTL